MNSFSYTIDLYNLDTEPIDKEFNRIEKQLDSLYDKFCNEKFMSKASKDVIDKESNKYLDFSFKQEALHNLKVEIEELSITKINPIYKAISYLFTDKGLYMIPIKK